MGPPRIHAELVANGAAVGRKRVARAMRLADLADVTPAQGTADRMGVGTTPLRHPIWSTGSSRPRPRCGLVLEMWGRAWEIFCNCELDHTFYGADQRYVADPTARGVMR